MSKPDRRLIYLTHPNVSIDPAIPVPDWDLSDTGRARVQAILGADWLGRVTGIFASTERKAVTAAAMLAEARGLPMTTRADMGENDRSATGYLPGPEFEAMADAFFAQPDTAVRGWEPARAAQARIVAAINDITAMPGQGDLLCVGHGAVGTLLMCHAAGWAIDRRHDQTGGGGGNLFALSLPRLTLLHGWRPMEAGPEPH